jgi:hypothetical protein
MTAKVPEYMTSLEWEMDPWHPSRIGRWKCKICGVAYWPPVHRLSSLLTGVPSDPSIPDLHEVGCPVVCPEKRGLAEAWMPERRR